MISIPGFPQWDLCIDRVRFGGPRRCATIGIVDWKFPRPIHHPNFVSCPDLDFKDVFQKLLSDGSTEPDFSNGCPLTMMTPDPCDAEGFDWAARNAWLDILFSGTGQRMQPASVNLIGRLPYYPALRQCDVVIGCVATAHDHVARLPYANCNLNVKVGGQEGVDDIDPLQVACQLHAGHGHRILVTSTDSGVAQADAVVRRIHVEDSIREAVAKVCRLWTPDVGYPHETTTNASAAISALFTGASPADLENAIPDWQSAFPIKQVYWQDMIDESIADWTILQIIAQEKTDADKMSVLLTNGGTDDGT